MSDVIQLQGTGVVLQNVDRILFKHISESLKNHLYEAVKIHLDKRS